MKTELLRWPCNDKLDVSSLIRIRNPMLLDRTRTQHLKRIMLRAAKVPIIYILVGLTLIALAYIDTIFPITEWKNLFDLTDKIGNIFIAFAILTFMYKF